jgi:hypothetical protein
MRAVSATTRVTNVALLSPGVKSSPEGRADAPFANPASPTQAAVQIRISQCTPSPAVGWPCVLGSVPIIFDTNLVCLETRISSSPEIHLTYI